MSFPRYPKYKPSGVDWLGDVPEGWEVKPLKCNFQLFGGSTPKSENEAFWNGDIAWATPADLGNTESLYISDTQRKISADGLKSCATSLVPPNSIILSTRASIGALAITQTAMCTNQGCKSLVPSARVSAKYFGRLLSVCSVELSIRGKGTTFLELSADELARFKTPIPPLPEQTAIAEFLDRETGKIDGLVVEQRRLMELLKEKRQAVISHAVTKGLNPHAPMKPSGIEWLGDVPVGWEVKPLRSVFKFSKGLTITKEDLRDEGVCCVNYGEIHSKYGFRLNPDIHPLRCVEPEYLSSNPDALIRDGDFVFADTSEDLEGSGNFTHLKSESPIFAGYHTIIARPRKGICSLFLAYQFHSSLFRSQIQRQVKGVKVFSISQGILKSAKCWLPPLPEQTAIVAFLETELAKFDTLTAEAQRAIDLLQERRTALISAAVTGQIDVRQHPKN